MADQIILTDEQFNAGVANNVANGVDFGTFTNEQISSFNNVNVQTNVQNPTTESVFGGSFPAGGETTITLPIVKPKFSGFTNNDWRVHISLPSIKSYSQSPILAPIINSGGLTFQYTPNIQIVSSATYDSLDVVHSNYQFSAYKASKIEAFNITADFYVETASDAAYWIAGLHFLRSISKMAYGDTENAGAPPPVVELSGYGPHVLENVPVVVTRVDIQLNNETDYISCKVGGQTNRVPIKSQWAVTCMPIYSKQQIRTFSLDSFVRGDYIGKHSGFI